MINKEDPIHTAPPQAKPGRLPAEGVELPLGFESSQELEEFLSGQVATRAQIAQAAAGCADGDGFDPNDPDMIDLIRVADDIFGAPEESPGETVSSPRLGSECLREIAQRIAEEIRPEMKRIARLHDIQALGLEEFFDDQGNQVAGDPIDIEALLRQKTIDFFAGLDEQ